MAFVAKCSFCKETKPTVCVYERGFISPDQYGLCSSCARKFIGCRKGRDLNGETMKTFKLVPVGEHTAHLLLARMDPLKRRAVSCGCEDCRGAKLECIHGCKHKKHKCCPQIPRGNFVVFHVDCKYPCTVCDRCLDKHIKTMSDAGKEYQIFMLEITPPMKFARGYVPRKEEEEEEGEQEENNNNKAE